MAEKLAAAQLEYILPQELDLLAAEGLKFKLLDMVHHEGDLTLDGREVERVSTPCIEIMVAAESAFYESGRKLRIFEPSNTLSDAFKSLGLVAEIEKWSVS
ncbi:MAG: hypothetical protein COB37_07270 [Kordiimonadales bacterium]|nr:MAG: hypothetical protein COB37_07270 [Kordiimonadales bacterium]